MASCVGNIRTKNYQNLIIGFQVTVENVGDVFFETRRIILSVCLCSGRYPRMYPCTLLLCCFS